MSCTGFDLRDYFFGELPEAERAAADRHVQGCGECAAGLEQLREMRSGLMMLRDEEPPQRIGFVSDKVFEPSPLRRWVSGFWLSGARMGFASAAMLSVALVIFAARPPQVIEKRVIDQALVEQDKKYRALLASSEEKHQMEERALAFRVSDYLRNVEKQMGMNREVAYNFSSSRKSQ